MPGPRRVRGTVVFSYPAHFFTITVANPTVVVDEDGTGTLYADVDLTGMAEQHLDQAEVATLAVTGPRSTAAPSPGRTS
jgi:hypothetical protein